MYGIKVDATAIARGLLDMVPDLGESYEAALSMGMLPAPLMESLTKMLGDKFDAITAKQLGVGVGEIADVLGAVGCRDMGEEMQREAAASRKKWIAHVIREVSCAMYHEAEMVV